MIEIKNSGNEFKELAVDMMPVIRGMEEVLKKHSVERLASITMSTDGYFTFSHAGTEWDFTRVCKNDAPKIQMNYMEELEWEE